MRLLLALCLLGSVAHADYFYRANRPFFRGPQLYELAIFSRAFPWEAPPAENPWISQEELRAELLAGEDWKFAEYRMDGYLSVGEDARVGDAVRKVESVLRHDDIVALYEWIPTGGAPGIPFRELIALVAVKRLDHTAKSQLLIEEHQKLEIERPVPEEISAADFGPFHWRLQNIPRADLRYFRGDLLHVNSLVLRRELSFIWLPYLYTLAYWHGILSLGRVIPPGQAIEIRGKRIEGPALFSPSHFVGEGYGARSRAFQRLTFRKIPVSGRFEFPDADAPSIMVNLLMADRHRFFLMLPAQLAERLKPGPTELDTTFMGPLSIAPMSVFGRFLPPDSILPLATEAETSLSPLCLWDLALAGVHPGETSSPAISWPTARLRRGP